MNKSQSIYFLHKHTQIGQLPKGQLTCKKKYAIQKLFDISLF